MLGNEQESPVVATTVWKSFKNHSLPQYVRNILDWFS